MSLINDALKQAQKNQSAPPAGSPSSLKLVPPVQSAPPAPAKSSSNRALVGGVLVVVVLGIVAAIFLASRAATNRTAAQPVAPTAPPSAATPAPAVEPTPAPVKVVESPPAKTSFFVKASDVPRLQGIFYVPGKSTAILDGKTVRAGDRCGNYTVKEIAKTSVTLTAADGSNVQINMTN
jgi:hypothetical protein